MFLAVVAATVLGGVILWNAGGERTPMAVFGALLMVMGGWVISLCLHEFAHAVTGFKFGDHGAELRGYLTLNPLKYAHPGLSLVLPLLLHRPGRHRISRRCGVHNQAASRKPNAARSRRRAADDIVLGGVLLV